MAGRDGPNLGEIWKSEVHGNCAVTDVRGNRAAINVHNPSAADGDRWHKQAGPSLLGETFGDDKTCAQDVKRRLTTSWPTRDIAPPLTLCILPKMLGLVARRRIYKYAIIGEVWKWRLNRYMIGDCMIRFYEQWTTDVQ